ncbi:MAG: HAD-IA family hydrolase [Leptospiraceae bacterium]|nr:HAD-IA family hydrolase [Leptospiraceae bacterium]
MIHIQKNPGKVYYSILKKHGLISEDFSHEEMGIFFRDSMREMLKYPNPEIRDRYISHPGGNDGWWKELITIFLKKVNGESFVVPGDNIFKEIFSIFDLIDTWKVEESFFELKDYLISNDIGLGIISNWDLRLRKLLTDMNLINYFKFVLISAEFGYEKPSEKIFLEAEKLCGFKSEEIIYVGDKIELDYYPPRKLGWNSFLIEIEENSNPGLEKIKKLIDLKSFIK